jgi:hypothetical protein
MWRRDCEIVTTVHAASPKTSQVKRYTPSNKSA